MRLWNYYVALTTTVFFFLSLLKYLYFFWALLGYTVAKVCASQQIQLGSPDHFSSWEVGSGDETMCILLLNSFFFFCHSLGFNGGLTSLLFFFSEFPAIGCIQHLFMHLVLQNTYVTKGQPRCLPLPPSPRNVVPTLSCNPRIWYPPRAWARVQINIPSMTSNWHS